MITGRRRLANGLAIVLSALAVAATGCGEDDAEPDREAEQPAATEEPGGGYEGADPDSSATETGEPEAPATETPVDPGQRGGTQAGSGPSSYEAFQTPTGNIGCRSDSAGTRCDITDYVYEPPPRPKKCEFDWGGSVSVGGEFPGQVSCVSDTVFDPGAPVLQYGQTNTVGGIACESSEAGLRCESEVTGHGFFLSTQQVDVF